MKKYLSTLKDKSHAEKSNFAFFTSLLLTGIIATVWFLTIFNNPAGYFETSDTEVQDLANAGSLFDVFKAGLK